MCVCVHVCALVWGFPGGSCGKESACNVGDPGLPLQYSCLENSMDRGTWWPVIVMGVTKNWTRMRK